MNMAESIEPLGFSARLKSALMNEYGTRGHNIEDVLRHYRKDPPAFEAEFLRIPGAGRVSLNELLDFFDRVGEDGSYAGRVIALSQDHARVAREAIDEVCHYVSTGSMVYSRLRDIQKWLTAGTIHIQQFGDERSMFKDRPHG